MSNNLGHPELVSIITNSLLLWQSSSHGFLGNPTNELLQLAVKRQQNIGWKSFIEGFWSLEWRECQRRHFYHATPNALAHFGFRKYSDVFGKLPGECSNIGMKYYTMMDKQYTHMKPWLWSLKSDWKWNQDCMTQTNLILQCQLSIDDKDMINKIYLRRRMI